MSVLRRARTWLILALRLLRRDNHLASSPGVASAADASGAGAGSEAHDSSSAKVGCLFGSIWPADRDYEE